MALLMSTCPLMFLLDLSAHRYTSNCLVQSLGFTHDFPDRNRFRDITTCHSRDTEDLVRRRLST